MDDAQAPLLSIIVPVYDVEDFIGDCLDSILGASEFGNHCQLVLVDDGSPDASMAIAEARCAGRDNVVIVRQSNGGLSAARNTGLRHAGGRYVWFVDSDDEICPHAIATLAACIRRFAPDVIAFEFETLGGSLERAPYLATYDMPVDPIDFLISGRPPSPVQFYVFSRASIDRAGLSFEPGIYHEDALFTPQALVGATSLVRLRDTCYRYRLRAGSIMSVSRPDKHLTDMLYIAERLGSLARARPVGSAARRALAREVGYALAAARHYAARITSAGRGTIASRSRILAAGHLWWRYFPPRVFVNYLRLLGLFLPLRRGKAQA